MDSRVHPERILGLKIGDAEVRCPQALETLKQGNAITANGHKWSIMHLLPFMRAVQSINWDYFLGKMAHIRNFCYLI